MSDPRLKQIKIKTGVVRRFGKEVTAYKNDAKKQELRVEKLKAELKDDHDIKKQEEVLQESLMMIPDIRKRLIASQADLKNILDSEQDLIDTEEYKSALAVIEETKDIAAGN